jgi:hypothetical protein
MELVGWIGMLGVFVGLAIVAAIITHERHQEPRKHSH